MAEKNEIWRPIEGYEGLYEVSSFGRVRNITTEHLLKPRYRGGYVRVVLYNNNHKSKQYHIHFLVAKAFIPNIENKPYVDHINTQKDDNRVDNLRWVTMRENYDNPISKKKHQDYLKTTIGHVTSIETRRKISIANTGRKHTEETRKKLSIAGMGRIPPNKGVSMRIESKEKLSKSLRWGYANGTIIPHNTKSVALYNEKGEFLKKWDSSRHASSELGLTPTNVCRHLKHNKPLKNGTILKYYEKG